MDGSEGSSSQNVTVVAEAVVKNSNPIADGIEMAAFIDDTMCSSASSSASIFHTWFDKLQNKRAELEGEIKTFYAEHKRLRGQSRSRENAEDRRRCEFEQGRICAAIEAFGGLVTATTNERPGFVMAEVSDSVAAFCKKKLAAVRKRARLAPYHFNDEEEDEDDDEDDCDVAPPAASKNKKGIKTAAESMPEPPASPPSVLRHVTDFASPTSMGATETTPENGTMTSTSTTVSVKRRRDETAASDAGKEAKKQRQISPRSLPPTVNLLAAVQKSEATTTDGDVIIEQVTAESGETGPIPSSSANHVEAQAQSKTEYDKKVAEEKRKEEEAKKEVEEKVKEEKRKLAQKATEVTGTTEETMAQNVVMVPLATMIPALMKEMIDTTACVVTGVKEVVEGTMETTVMPGMAKMEATTDEPRPITVENREVTMETQINANKVVLNVSQNPNSNVDQSLSIEKVKSVAKEKFRENVIAKYQKLKVAGTETKLDIIDCYMTIYMKLKNESDIEEFRESINAQNQSENTTTSTSFSENSEVLRQQKRLKDSDSLPIGKSDFEENSNNDRDDDSDTDSITEFEIDPNPIKKQMEDKKPLEFKEFVDKISGAVKRITVVAGGGRGKTVDSKRLMVEWALGRYLQRFFMVVRLDMKLVDLEKGLFDNMLGHYEFLKTSLGNDIDALRKAMVEDEQILWILDGIDEISQMSDISDAKKFLNREINSNIMDTFVLFMRPEGLHMIDQMETTDLEFTLEDVEQEECRKFINKFPFTDDTDDTDYTSERKRSEIFKQYRSNSSVTQLMKIPMNVAILCHLYDYPKLTKNIQNEMDMLLSLLALKIKSDMLKSIELKLESEENGNKKKKLSLRELEIKEMDTDEILKENEKKLQAVGHAIIACNQNHLTGFKDLPEKTLRKQLLKDLKDEDAVKEVLRWTILEPFINKNSRTRRIDHRNLRELLTTLFLVTNREPLSLPKEKFPMQNTIITLMQCLVTMIMKKKNDLPPKDVVTCLDIFLEQILASSTALTEWRLTQGVSELVDLGLRIPEVGLEKLLSMVFEKTKRLFPTETYNLLQNLTPHYLEYLRIHAAVANHCMECKWPECKADAIIRGIDPAKWNETSWPNKNYFCVHQLWYITETFSAISFFPRRKAACYTRILAYLHERSED